MKQFLTSVHKFYCLYPFCSRFVPLLYPFYSGFITFFPKDFPNTYIIHTYTYLYKYEHLSFYYILVMYYVCFTLKRV